MELHHTFEIPTGPDHAWAVLMDIPRIAPCLPGAELTGVAGDNAYKGTARVKVGPIQLTFDGKAEISEIDAAARTARVSARGSDAKGRGNAAAEMRFSLSEAGPGRARVDVTTELTMTGAVAQYGRASGLIDEIARQIIADFTRNLAAEIAKDQPTGAAAPSEPRAPQAMSGLSVLFRALAAMIRRWLGLSRA